MRFFLHGGPDRECQIHVISNVRRRKHDFFEIRPTSTIFCTHLGGFGIGFVGVFLAVQPKSRMIKKSARKIIVYYFFYLGSKIKKFLDFQKSGPKIFGSRISKIPEISKMNFFSRSNFSTDFFRPTFVFYHFFFRPIFFRPNVSRRFFSANLFSPMADKDELECTQGHLGASGRPLVASTNAPDVPSDYIL